MMLRDAFGLSLEADWVEQSLHRVLSGGYRTPDITEPGARAWVAPCLRKFCGKRCSARLNTPSATAGASSFSFTNSRQRLVATVAFVFLAKLPPSSWLPCDKPLRMLLLHFPRQPAAR